MKNLTYNNMVKATKMIEAKGYTHEEANDIAINCFAMYSSYKGSGYYAPNVEYFIGKIATKEEWLNR